MFLKKKVGRKLLVVKYHQNMMNNCKILYQKLVVRIINLELIFMSQYLNEFLFSFLFVTKKCFISKIFKIIMKKK